MSTVLDKISEGRKRNRVTISDMADALGLTKSTVSRAMNGYPDILKPPKTASSGWRINFSTDP